MKQHWVDRHGFLAGLAFIAVIVAVGLIAVFVVGGAFLLWRDHREAVISALVGAVVGGTVVFAVMRRRSRRSGPRRG
jgi:hypothetical protein